MSIISVLFPFLFMIVLYGLAVYALILGIQLLKLLIKKTKDSM